MQLYEDLLAIERSSKLRDAAIQRGDRVLNVQNKRRGVAARRGDGTFGEIIPGETAVRDQATSLPEARSPLLRSALR
jgi:hypothetical protein